MERNAGGARRARFCGGGFWIFLAAGAAAGRGDENPRASIAFRGRRRGRGVRIWRGACSCRYRWVIVGCGNNFTERIAPISESLFERGRKAPPLKRRGYSNSLPHDELLYPGS